MPAVVWIHGGGWRKGDKAGVEQTAKAFVDKGYTFFSINYRFVPDVTVKEMAGDVAKAIRWVRDTAQSFGGDPNWIIVMGHSAGAHLAALVCTDEKYLKAEKLSLANIKACVPIDVSVYDIPKRLNDGGEVSPETFKAVFGDKIDLQRDLSPVTHIAMGKSIPPFLILHVADRPDTKAQSQWFAEKLEKASVPANVYAAEGKTHETIGSELGSPEDKPTQAVLDFLNKSVLDGSVVMRRHNGDLLRWSREDQLARVARGGFSDEETNRAIEIATKLISEGANVNVRAGPQEETPLFPAVHEGAVPMVKFFLSQKVDVSLRDWCGSTVLHTAAWYGRVEPMRLLLAAGADANVADVDGDTPLHRVLLPDTSGLGPDLAERQAIVQMLTKAGAKATTLNKAGKSPLDMAIELKEQSLINALKAVQK